jgi:hypothetical protein
VTQPIIGIRELLAIKKAATWGTAVAGAASDGVLFLTGGAKRDATVQVDQSRGIAFTRDGYAGPITSSSSYTFNLRYEGLTNLLAAMIMGTAGAPAAQGATAAYLIALKWSVDPYGLMVTVAKSMISYIEEITTAKVTKVTVSGEVGPAPLQMTVDFIGTNREVASAVNTVGTFASVTVPTGADKNAVMFSQLAFRMNAQSAGALSSGDQIYPSKFTLTIDRKLQGAYTGAYRTTGANPQDMIDEPLAQSLPDISLTLEFPVHTGTTYLTALAADTRYKMDITATGLLIASTYYYQHLWQFPQLQMKSDNPTDGSGRITEPIEFFVHGAAAAPTGMTGITDPLWWTQINTRTTNLLA